MAKILIVDDDPKAVKLMGYILYKEGYEVVPALSGEEALKLLKAEKPDLVILDIMMPEMDGYEVCRRIRADPETTKIPVIMLTAKAMLEDKIAGFEAGADDYITKPVLPAELLARVKVLLSRTTPAEAPKKGKTIAFVGAKGGVGVTSVAVNVGVILVKDGKPTILLDMQPYGWAVANLLGLALSKVDQSFLNVKPQDLNKSTVESFLNEHPSGLLVFPSIFPNFSSREVSPEFVEKLVDILSSMADFVLVDVGNRFIPVVESILKGANKVVLVTESDPLALKIGASLIKEMENFGVRGIKLITVVVNRTRSETALTKQQAEELLGRSIQVVIPPAPELFHQAEKSNAPAVLLQPNSLVTDQIKAVAELIKG